MLTKYYLLESCASMLPTLVVSLCRNHDLDKTFLGPIYLEPEHHHLQFPFLWLSQKNRNESFWCLISQDLVQLPHSMVQTHLTYFKNFRNRLILMATTNERIKTQECGFTRRSSHITATKTTFQRSHKIGKILIF